MLRVNGGPAGSGTKLPMQPRKGDWVCVNGHHNRGAWVRCMTAGCNVKRG